jgi:hypothetical protein
MSESRDYLDAHLLLREWERERDFAYVKKTWLRGYASSRIGQALKTSYYEAWSRVVDRWLESPATRVRCAVLRVEPASIVGFAVVTEMPERNIAHWVYVKDKWQGNGVARMIIQSFRDITWTYTHVFQERTDRNDHGRDVWTDRVPKGWVYESPVAPYGTVSNVADFLASFPPKELSAPTAPSSGEHPRQAHRERRPED